MLNDTDTAIQLYNYLADHLEADGNTAALAVTKLNGDLAIATALNNIATAIDNHAETLEQSIAHLERETYDIIQARFDLQQDNREEATD